MPYIITSKVVDQDGYPIGHTVVISEISTTVGLPAADVWAEPDGTFRFVPMSQTSLITIEAYGYEPKIYVANQVPAEIRLNTALVIEGKTTPKKKEDYTWLYVLAGLGLVGAIVFSQRKPAATAATPAKGLSLPAAKPKTVTLSF